MEWWVINQLRAKVVWDLKEFIPHDYFESNRDDFKINAPLKGIDHLSEELRWGWLAGKIGNELSHKSNKIMSPRQKAASDLLLDLGNLASATARHEIMLLFAKFAADKGVEIPGARICTEDIKEKWLPAFKNNYLVTLKQYSNYLDEMELKPFLELLIAVNNPLNLVKYSGRTLNKEDVKRLVTEIILHFKDLIENKGLWKILWSNNDLHHNEKHAQAMFFAVAHTYCVVNNLDISPEPNSGNGSVDFKFSCGFDAKLLVEIKLSTNKILRGYEKQLELYKKAEGTDAAMYLIIDVGGLGGKLSKLEDSRKEFLESNATASEIFYVDGNRKLSASTA